MVDDGADTPKYCAGPGIAITVTGTLAMAGRPVSLAVIVWAPTVLNSTRMLQVPLIKAHDPGTNAGSEPVIVIPPL